MVGDFLFEALFFVYAFVSEVWQSIQNRRDVLYTDHSRLVTQYEQELARVFFIMYVDGGNLRKLHDTGRIHPRHHAIVVLPRHPNEQVAFHVACKQQRERLDKLHNGHI